MISHSNLKSTESIEEIILDDSETENSEDEEVTIISSKTAKPIYKIKCRSLLRKNFRLRGLLPNEHDKSYFEILNLPIVKRCCIEHSYFVRNRHKSSRYNFRNLPVSVSNTSQFGNDKLAKQPTIDAECLASKLNSVFLKDSFITNNVNAKKKKHSISSSSCSSGRDSSVDDLNDLDYCPEDNSTESDTDFASVGSCESVKEIYKTPEVLEDASSDGGGKNRLVLNKINTKVVPNKICRFNDYFDKFKDMQKLLKAKCVSDRVKTGKLPLPRLKKIIGQRKGDKILKMPEYLFPMPDLTKINDGEKNWKVEYKDSEVQSLGLDDLLLKASELNAENFTKALGRKLEPIKANFNCNESSETVFAIPKTKKSPENSCESDGDISKRTDTKTIKLDISKPFFEASKPKEPETVQPVQEVSPKKTGIKVKTVENINEEFKDSLGRLKSIDREISSGLDRTNFDVAIEETEREKNFREELEKNSEGNKPFIMTIIQNKTEKQRPAILRNSYLKKKASLEKLILRDNITDKTIKSKIDRELSSMTSLGNIEKREEKLDLRCLNSKLLEKSVNFNRNLCRKSFSAYPNIFEEMDTEKIVDGEGRFAVKKRNIPFILNHNRKVRQIELSSVSKTSSKLVKLSEGTEKLLPNEKTFKITSIEQKVGPKEINRRFIKVVPYEPINKLCQLPKTTEFQKKLSDEEPDSPQKDRKSNNVLSLTTFSKILKEILPDKWFMCLDKKYGLQIIKTHIDEFLNPTILISVVIARCGKVTVNVRGKQLSKSHEIFSNLCDIRNSKNKLSLNYVLAILNKLRHRSVCFGCDDPFLKKYWSDDGVVENQTESQQVYRSHLCHLLVSLGKRRCYPCYRINESLKKRYRRDKQNEKPKLEKEKESKDVPEEMQQPEQTLKTHFQTRGVKRNLEDFLEESFSTMKQQIVDEIEKNKKLGERENALKAQEEVLSFMGLTRKECLDNTVRRSKRKKNSFYKLQQPIKKKTDQKELEFLEKYWTDINTLFSTSLLFGAYSRTGRSRLREKCRMFQKLLTTWKNIVTSNPDWIGEISVPNELTDGDSSPIKDSNVDQFEKMDVPALRAYIINSVKEVNRIKHKLRTRNSYFKVLYNKFVKRRMKRTATLDQNSKTKESGSSATSTTNTPTPNEISSDENSRDKEKITVEESMRGGDSLMSSLSDVE